jgi:Fic family protein
MNKQSSRDKDRGTWIALGLILVVCFALLLLIGMDGVEETAAQAVGLATQIRQLFEKDRQRISKMGRAAGSALRVHELLQRQPIVSVPTATEKLGLSAPTVRAAIEALGKAGIVRELSGKRRDRVFGYRRYLDLMGSDTKA